jgi:hypothetical protein
VKANGKEQVPERMDGIGVGLYNGLILFGIWFWWAFKSYGVSSLIPSLH